MLERAVEGRFFLLQKTFYWPKVKELGARAFVGPSKAEGFTARTGLDNRWLARDFRRIRLNGSKPYRPCHDVHRPRAGDRPLRANVAI